VLRVSITALANHYMLHLTGDSFINDGC